MHHGPPGTLTGAKREARDRFICNANVSLRDILSHTACFCTCTRTVAVHTIAHYTLLSVLYCYSIHEIVLTFVVTSK